MCVSLFFYSLLTVDTFEDRNKAQDDDFALIGTNVSMKTLDHAYTLHLPVQLWNSAKSVHDITGKLTISLLLLQVLSACKRLFFTQ